MGSGSSKSKEPKKKAYKDDRKLLHQEIRIDDVNSEGIPAGEDAPKGQGINCIAITPDGTKLCAGGEDKIARVYDLMTEQIELNLTLVGHQSYINWIVCDDRKMFTASADRCINKWNLDSDQCVRSLKGHTGPVNRMILIEDLLVSSSYDKTVRVWNADSGDCLKVCEEHKRGVYPLRYVLTSPQPAESQVQIHRCLTDLENNPDLIVSGSADFTAICWTMVSDEPLVVFRGHQGAVLCLEVSGEVLYTGSMDNTCRSWELHSGKPLRTFEGHQAGVLHLHIINRVLFSGSADHTVKCWVADFGECTRVYRGHTHSIVSMVLLNGMLITGSGDAIVRAYDAKNGGTKKIYRGHKGTVNTVLYHKEKIYSASHDGSIRVWLAEGLCDAPNVIDSNDNSNATSRIDVN